MASETTAKGTIFLVFSKALFLVGSVLIHVFLGRFLGPESYGQYGLVMSILLWFEVIVNSAIPWAVSKVISENKKLAKSVFRQAIVLQLLFSLTVLTIFVLLSSTLARLFGDQAVKLLLWWAALDIPFFALLSVFLTYYNGLQQFGRQGISSIGRILFKVIATVLLVASGFSVAGALVGNILGSALALVVAVCLLRLPSSSSQRIRLIQRVLDFGVPYTLFLLVAQLLISLDLWSVKIFLEDTAATGFYTSAQTISRVPYFLFLGLTTALFPALSQSTSSGQVHISRIQIRQAMRLQAMILLPAGAIVSSSAGEVVKLFFGSDFHPAVWPLIILMWGMVLYTMFYNLSMILSVSGRPLMTLSFSVALMLADGLLNWLLVPVMGLNGAALATAIISLVGMVVLGILVSRQFGSLMAASAIAKMLLAAAVIFCLSLLVPLEGIWLVLKGLILLALFVAGMVLVREVREEDFRRVKNLWPT